MSAKNERYHTRIWNGDVFRGTYIVYGATTENTETVFACNIVAETLEEDDYKELRAYRLQRARLGKTPPPLRKDALHHELLAVFGPEMSPTEAVQTLRLLAQRIERDGMLIGRKSKDGDFLVETIDGKIWA